MELTSSNKIINLLLSAVGEKLNTSESSHHDYWTFNHKSYSNNDQLCYNHGNRMAKRKIIILECLQSGGQPIPTATDFQRTSKSQISCHTDRYRLLPHSRYNIKLMALFSTFWCFCVALKT